METSAKLYSLSFSNVKTYLFVFLFVAGNIALPQLCHLVPMGGPTLLPIYFFTLIAAYKFGFRVGLLTAKGTIIALGCVLTKDFPEYSIVGGVPSKLIKKRKTNV